MLLFGNSEIEIFLCDPLHAMAIQHTCYDKSSLVAKLPGKARQMSKGMAFANCAASAAAELPLICSCCKIARDYASSRSTVSSEDSAPSMKCGWMPAAVRRWRCSM